MNDAMPPSSPQQIVQALVACGVDRAGIVVEEHGEPTGIIIRIRREGRPPGNRMDCIYRAAIEALVIFDDQASQQAYDRYAFDQSRPELLDSARSELAGLGLLDHFPRRAAFAGMSDYARALERHAGYVPGSTLEVSGDRVLVGGEAPSTTKAGFDRLVRLMAVVVYAQAIGDIGNMSFLGKSPVPVPSK